MKHEGSSPTTSNMSSTWASLLSNGSIHHALFALEIWWHVENKHIFFLKSKTAPS
ncbi:hypothetical protein Lal_00041149 [Lupinus albus]|nr:hypothetical protein Lal_00041149 [Lupinus albus]